MPDKLNAIGSASIYWLDEPPNSDEVDYQDDLNGPPEEGKSYYLVSYSGVTNAIDTYDNQLSLLLKNYSRLKHAAYDSANPIDGAEMICQPAAWCVWLPPLLKLNGFSYDNDELADGSEEWEDLHGKPCLPQVEMVSDISIVQVVPTGISFEIKKHHHDSYFGEFLSQKAVFKVVVKKVVNIQKIADEFQPLRTDINPGYTEDESRIYFNYKNIFVFNNFELGYGGWWIYIKSGDEVRQVLNDHSEHCAGGDELIQISNIGIPLEFFEKLTAAGS